MDKKLLGTKQKLSELKNIHKRLQNKDDKKAIRLSELGIRYYKAKYELLKYMQNGK